MDNVDSVLINKILLSYEDLGEKKNNKRNCKKCKC